MGVLELVMKWNRATVLKAFATYALIYGLYRAIRFLVFYRRIFKFFNSCQGTKDFSWTKGNLHVFSRNSEERIELEKKWMQLYPKYYRIWFGPLGPRIKIYHPDTIRPIVKSSEPKPRGSGATYEPLIPWLGEGLLISEGKRWARARRLLTPGFHFDILKAYIDVGNQAIDIMLEKIDKHVEKGTSFNLFDVVSLCTFDILMRCAMSVKEDIQTNGNGHPYVKAVNEILELIADRAFNVFHHFNIVYYNTSKGRQFKKHCKFVHEFSERIIEQRRNILEKEGPPTKRYLDFLDILLTARDSENKGLSLLEIRNEVDTFLFEGHDTTTSGIAWTLYTMASKPELQSQVQEELDGVLSNRHSKHIKWDDIPKFEFLNRCVKESMRFHSPVPNVSRRLTKEMTIDGKAYPAGTIFTIGIWNLHHNPDVWEQPEVFDPDRFLPENIEKKDPYAYIPFSAGPRNCIGQHFALDEEKVMIGRVLERYHLELDKERTVGRRIAGVMKSTDGIWVYAKHRH